MRGKYEIQDGLFIAFIGVPGVGKTTLATALAHELDAHVFIEPGEEAWPIDRTKSWLEQIDLIETWVCESNWQNFQKARQLADAGEITVADAGIFLVNRELIHAPCYSYWYGHMSYAVKEKIYAQAVEDWMTAPCPDVLILLDTDQENWLRFLQQRGRTSDADPEFLRDFAIQHAVIAQAAECFAKDRDITYLKFKNEYIPPEQNAELLSQQLALLFPKKNVRDTKLISMNTNINYQFIIDDLEFRLVTDADFDYLAQIDADAELRSFFPLPPLSKEEIKEKIRSYQKKIY